MPMHPLAAEFAHVADAYERGRPEYAPAVVGPGGGLGILRAVPDWGGASWAHEVGSLLAGLRPEHPHFDGPSWREQISRAEVFSPLRELQMTTEQPADPTRITDYFKSISWVAALPAPERQRTLEQVDALVSAGQTPDTFRVRTTIGLTTRS